MPRSAEQIAEDYDLYRRTMKPRRATAAGAKPKTATGEAPVKAGAPAKKVKRIKRRNSA
jgi:hypothetical protein